MLVCCFSFESYATPIHCDELYKARPFNMALIWGANGVGYEVACYYQKSNDDMWAVYKISGYGATFKPLTGNWTTTPAGIATCHVRDGNTFDSCVFDKSTG